MRTRLLILTLLFITTALFGQISKKIISNTSLIGQWTCCGKIDIATASEMILQRGIDTTCINNICASTSLVFNANDSLDFMTYRGCRGDISSESSRMNGFTWSISNNGKSSMLILFYGNEKQYKFSILSVTASQLKLRKI